VSLTLSDVRRIAADVAKQQDPPLEVMGATPAEGDSAYAEVMLTIRGCHVEPCRMLIGVSRDASEPECRRVLQERLQQHRTATRAEAPSRFSRRDCTTE
jgi:hypothetical protein